METVVISAEWTDEQAEAVVDMLPEAPEQACHLLMVLACTFAMELGLQKTHFLAEVEKCFDLVVSEVGLQ